MLVTNTGRNFDYLNIKKDSIHIPDILHSLPNINRFLGHSIRPYSVGEHTYLGLKLAEKLGYTTLQKLHWFKHDFTEAYVGDCPTPLKKLLKEFSAIEHAVERAIEEHLLLEPLTEEDELMVKRIDNTMLVLEMRDLTLHDYSQFINELTYTNVIFDPSFSINKERCKYGNDINSLLVEAFEDLMAEYTGIAKGRRFNIYASIKTDNYKINEVKNMQFDSKEEALKYAEEFALELYNLNPILDMTELIKIHKIKYEPFALDWYNREAKKNVEFFIEEIL